MQLEDVSVIYANTILLEKDFGYKPSMYLRTVLINFAEWYKYFLYD